MLRRSAEQPRCDSLCSSARGSLLRREPRRGHRAWWQRGVQARRRRHRVV